jgi:murein DD-endopeptidase MepM/ murein hydrolase activator NlpD
VLSAAAIVIGSVVTVTVGQAVATAKDSTPPARRTSILDGHYVARAAATAPASRHATAISRSAPRPPTSPNRKTRLGNEAESTPANKADLRLVVKDRLLREPAADAGTFAKRSPSQKWVYPTRNFHVTEMFGVPGPYWASGYHTGIDFATAYGTPVVAVGIGTVVRTGWDGSYGNQIRMQLPNGDQVWYNHLSSIAVTRGQPVARGQGLGRVGDTGNALGYHLHLEYRVSGHLSHPVDPLPYFVDHGLPLR